MNRLTSEWQRLYLVPSQAPASERLDLESAQARLIDSSSRVRALVLELARPAAWEPLAKVWRGVQADLELPAPAIAVSGVDGYQLWFSLAEPVAATQAAAFLEALRLRYLGDVARARVTLLPALELMTPGAAAGEQPAPTARHARMVPALQAQTGNWSAFLAPDLAPVFSEEPWLDIPPNPAGQADLLAKLDSIEAADFQTALERLGRPPMPEPTPLTTTVPAPALAELQPNSDRQAEAAPSAASDNMPSPAQAHSNPTDFLLAVMNDEAVAMGLRIEAATALLPYFDDRPQPPLS
jgi:hypothetical protein